MPERVFFSGIGMSPTQDQGLLPKARDFASASSASAMRPPRMQATLMAV